MFKKRVDQGPAAAKASPGAILEAPGDLEIDRVRTLRRGRFRGGMLEDIFAGSNEAGYLGRRESVQRWLSAVG